MQEKKDKEELEPANPKKRRKSRSKSPAPKKKDAKNTDPKSNPSRALIQPRKSQPPSLEKATEGGKFTAQSTREEFLEGLDLGPPALHYLDKGGYNKAWDLTFLREDDIRHKMGLTAMQQRRLDSKIKIYLPTQEQALENDC